MHEMCSLAFWGYFLFCTRTYIFEVIHWFTPPSFSPPTPFFFSVCCLVFVLAIFLFQWRCLQCSAEAGGPSLVHVAVKPEFLEENNGVLCVF